MRDEWTEKTLSVVTEIVNQHSLGVDREAFILFKKCLKIYPPESDNEDNTIEFINIYSAGRGGGTSKKTGNLIVNLRKVMSGSAIALTGAGAATHIITPTLLMALIALLGVCLRFSKLEEIKIDPEHALVVYALFKNVNENSEIGVDDALTVSTQIFNFQNFPALSKQRFDVILKNLQHMRVLRKNGDIVKMIEQVKIAS